MSEDYKSTRKALNARTAIEVIEEQIKEYSNDENWNQEDRFIQGKVSGLKQALNLINKKK